ncbi:MAG TPA: peptidylprolyl isomerase [Polyangia bacterium]
MSRGASSNLGRTASKQRSGAPQAIFGHGRGRRPGWLGLLLGALLVTACDRAKTGATVGTPSPPVPTSAATPPPPSDLPAPGQETAGGSMAPVVPEAEAIAPPAPGTPRMLLTPQKLRRKAPKRFRVKFTTTEGSFTVAVTRAWAPQGADRLYNLAAANFYKGNRVHRVLGRTLVQFGVHGDPAVNRAWYAATIPDDARRRPNLRGAVALVGAGQNDRRTELLISLRPNPGLDAQNVAPLGQVIRGLDVLDGFRRTFPHGAAQLDKRELLVRGEAYAADAFPGLAQITKVELAR